MKQKPSRYLELAEELERGFLPVISGKLEVQIARDVAGAGGKLRTIAESEWRQIHEEPLAPATPQDCLRFRASVTRAAHLCLVWIDPKGAAHLISPWHGGKWPAHTDSGAPAAACERVFAPDDFLPGMTGFPLKAAEAGAETIVFVASAEALDLAALRKAFTSLPPVRRWQEPQPWLPLPITGRVRTPRRRAAGTARGSLDDDRGPDFERLDAATTDLLRRHGELATRLRAHDLDFACGVSLFNAARAA